MTDTADQIERIVREVLAELLAHPVAPGQSPLASASPATAAPQASSPVRSDPPPAALEPPPGDVVIPDRVVTLAELPDQFDGVRRLVVAARAVVTPAVYDLVQRRHLALVRAPSPEQSDSSKVRALVVTLGSYDAKPLLAAVAQQGYPVEARTLDCVIRSSDLLRDEIRSTATLGVLLTRHVAAALCVANRLAGLRAVCGTTPAATAADASAVGANVLVLDPRAQPLFPTRQTIVAFLQGGLRPCPPSLEERLR